MKRLILIISVILLSVSVQAQIIRANPFHRAIATGPTVYTDDFEAYSAAALAGQGNWIQGVNAMNVVDVGGDNQINPGQNSGYSVCIYNDDFSDDQYSQIVVDAGTQSSAYVGVGVRLTGSGATLCGYSILMKGASGTATYLHKITNGTFATLASSSTICSPGDVIKITAVGTTITVYQNGNPITSISDDGAVTDATYATGKAGIVGYHNVDYKLDNWQGGDL